MSTTKIRNFFGFKTQIIPKKQFILTTLKFSVKIIHEQNLFGNLLRYIYQTFDLFLRGYDVFACHGAWLWEKGHTIKYLNISTDLPDFGSSNVWEDSLTPSTGKSFSMLKHYNDSICID